MTDLAPPRGTRDFYPDDLRLRSWLFERFRGTALAFGFEEVDAPLVEHAELYMRKAGEEIVDQLYHFHLHDRHLALRPELTPSLARRFRADKKAWVYFQSRPPSYRQTVIWWIVSAKKDETRERRFGILLEDCRSERILAAFKWERSK